MTGEVVVVGAGPGGLAAAMLMAAAGAKVTVYEREPHVGGRTSAIIGDGFTFDLGPTFFLFEPVLEQIFAASGANLHDEVTLARLDPQYRVTFGAGGQVDCTPDPARMAERVGALSPTDAARLGDFLAENRHKLAVTEPCLEMPYHRLRDLLTPRMARLLPVLRPFTSIDTYLRRYFDDPRIRLLFSFQSKYLGMSPFQCPSLFSILSFIEYEYGVWHPIGGCNALTAAMARVAERQGVTFRMGCPVESIQFRGRRATGVVTGDGEHHADAVIVNGDFASTVPRLIPGHVRPSWSNAVIARKRYSCSTFMLYLGLDGPLDGLAHHNIYIARDYERNLREVERLHVLSDDPSFYVQNACVTDPSLAPSGCSTLYLLVPVTHMHRHVDWDCERERFRAVALRQLAKIGLTDVESRIRFERMITPADWERAGIHRGAVFNLAHNLGQMLIFRPHNRFNDTERVYLVGGGTHPGSGLPVIFESAKISARLAAEDLGLEPAWLKTAFDQGLPAPN